MIEMAIAALAEESRDLSEEEAATVMDEIMKAKATPAQFGAFVVALKDKGETVDEIVGMARVMREHSLKVHVPSRPLLDTCGTGGSSLNAFNVSTAAAFVAAAAGAKVAKHGNRAMTSQSGSADLLEALGAEISLTADQVASCIERTGVGFLFAQSFHPAMKFAAPLRREIGIRTVFNILGPLTNPASANCHVLGTPSTEIAALLAAALARLGVRHALVVSSDEGLDEISVSAPTTLFEIRGHEILKQKVTPKELGIVERTFDEILGGSATENAEALRRVLSGTGSEALRDFIAVNAGAGLYVSGLASSIMQGTEQSLAAIDEGEAAARLGAFIEATRRG